MSSAVEAELGALFMNAKQAVVIWAMLAEMGHPQLPMPIQTDHSTAMGAITNIILPKATKAINMQFHWLWGREQQKLFHYLWHPETTNLANYWTEHHSTTHHRAM